MTREPVVIANSVAALISAVIVALVALGYLPWDEVQQAAVMGVVVAAVNIIAAMWARPQVTPLNSPRDIDGKTLIRSEGIPALKELDKLIDEAEEEDRARKSDSLVYLVDKPDRVR